MAKRLQERLMRNQQPPETLRAIRLDLDSLLMDERRKTLLFIVGAAWLMFAAYFVTRPFIHSILPYWFIFLLAAFAGIISIFYRFRLIRTGFLVSGWGGVILFVIEYYSVGAKQLGVVVDATTIITLVGTLYFRRRYLFYANVASFVLLLIGLSQAVQLHMSDTDRFNLMIDACAFWLFVTFACWMFMTRSLKLLEKLSQAKEAMMMDTLTATYNRVYFDATLENLELNLHAENVTLFILDLDHFKQVNDTFGHLVGDQVLAHFTKLIKGIIRRSDVLTRIGGEEFSLIIRHDSRLDLVDYAQRLLAAIRERPYVTETGMQVLLSSSIGGATFNAEKESIHGCLNRADQALYQAKAAGRDCAVIAAW